ncbi:hypothetical protein, partial [Oceanibaculum nanhaiense]|uniref:hypothetical protein n=1 Tax=Oceanibaculum nanhaiense TaxID=1909734 RepID=UPI001C3C48B7
AGLDLPLAGTPIYPCVGQTGTSQKTQEAGIRWRQNIAIVLIAVVSLWFNADAGLLASGFGSAGQAQGAEAHSAGAHALHGHVPAHPHGYDHGGVPEGDTQGNTTLDHSICSAHCVPAVMGLAAQAMPPQHFDRVAISRLPGPPGHRADPPLIPPEYRS